MTKIYKTNESDFNFNKKIAPTSSYMVERLVATAFIIVSGLIFFNTPHSASLLNNAQHVQNISKNSEVSTQYPDYVVTAEDKKLFEDIFNYNTNSPVSNNTDVKYFNDNIRKDDNLNADFVNKNNDNIVISSKIISIDSADKNQIMKENGFANLDYVDIVVQKTYQKGEEVYFEQQMVNVKLENHKIISLNTHRMID